MQTFRYTYTRAPGETLRQFASRMLRLPRTVWREMPIADIAYTYDAALDACHVDVTRVAPERPRRRSCRGGSSNRPSRRLEHCHG